MGEAFGGPRNPDKKAYVFDAKPCPVQEVEEIDIISNLP